MLTAHDLLPREPRPGQVRAQRRLFDASTRCRALASTAAAAGRAARACRPAKVHVIHHGAFAHVAAAAGGSAAARAGRRGRAGGAVLRAAAPVQGPGDAAASVAGDRRGAAVDRRAADDGPGAAAGAGRPPPSGSCRGSSPTPSCRRCFAAPTSSCCPTRGPSALTSPACWRRRWRSARPVVLTDVGGFSEVAAAGARSAGAGGGPGGAAGCAGGADRPTRRRGSGWGPRRWPRPGDRTPGTRRRAPRWRSTSRSAADQDATRPARRSALGAGPPRRGPPAPPRCRTARSSAARPAWATAPTLICPT